MNLANSVPSHSPSGRSNLKKWLMLALLCAAASTIYIFPFLRYSYYEPLRLALDLTHSEFGIVQGVNGLTSTLGYLPGGWLADRYSSRKLLCFALIATGLSGFYFSTFPSFTGAVVLFGFWGVSTLVIFWAPLIKATRDLGDASEQGRLFGFLEGGRGLVGSIVGLGTLALFTCMGEGEVGLLWVINVSAVIVISAGLAIWFFFEDAVIEDKDDSDSVLGGVLQAIKMPQVWILGGIIFCSYSLFVGQTYITPYMTEVLGATVAFGALMGLIRTYGLQTCGGPASGILADRIGSSNKVLIGAFTCTSITLVLFLVIPPSSAMIWLVAANMIFMGLGVFALRGNFFATIAESRIPQYMTGTVVGVASMVGYLPEMFSYWLIGTWLDNYPGVQGYRILFSYHLGVSILGLILAFTLFRLNRRFRLDNA